MTDPTAAAAAPSALRAAAPSRVRIFDTTLRDGEQAPGFSMDPAAKLRMAKALAALRVDVIEAGFAAASPGDAAGIAEIARTVEGPIVCSLARAVEGDIRAAARAIAEAPRRRIHCFLGTSPLHREFKLNLTREQVIERIRASVALARELCDDVEFSAEDAIRTERDFLVEALSAAVAAGATTLNVPDTVGYTTPDEIHDLFRHLTTHVDGAGRVTFSAHCHDDLGMAVANSLAAVRGGARQIECAVNGIGERAGNCALEEVVMAIRTRGDHYGVATGVDTTRIAAASRLLAQVTNSPPPRNKAIVGANAFAHESGIHQHGVLRNRETYEIMRPEDIGLAVDGLVLGKHSGRAAIAARARTLGFAIEGEALDRAFAAFKTVADEVGIIDSARLLAILAGESDKAEHGWSVGHIDLSAPRGEGAAAAASVELVADGRRGSAVATAAGALDAAFAAVSKVVGVPARVHHLEMQYIAADADEAPPAAAEPGGQGASVLVEISVEVGEAVYAGRARARDIVPCCVAAYLDAVSNAEAVARVRAGGQARAAA